MGTMKKQVIFLAGHQTVCERHDAQPYKTQYKYNKTYCE